MSAATRFRGSSRLCQHITAESTPRYQIDRQVATEQSTNSPSTDCIALSRQGPIPPTRLGANPALFEAPEDDALGYRVWPQYIVVITLQPSAKRRRTAQRTSSSLADSDPSIGHGLCSSFFDLERPRKQTAVIFATDGPRSDGLPGRTRSLTTLISTIPDH